MRVTFRGTEIEFNLDELLPFDMYLQQLCEHFNIVDVSSVALLRKHRRQYIRSSEWESLKLGKDEELVLLDQSSEAIRVVRSLAEMANILQTRKNGETEENKEYSSSTDKLDQKSEEPSTSSSPDSKLEHKHVHNELKKCVFQLQDHLKIDVFAEEFISNAGMETLLKVIDVSEGNTEAYALKALGCAMVYLNALEYINSNKYVLDTLMQMVFSVNINVCRQALVLVFVVCEFLKDGFELVDEAALKIATQRSSDPYKEFVELIGSGDLDVQTNALTLFNVLVKKSPNDFSTKRLLMSLQKVGIFDILEAQSQVHHEDFITQREIFRVSTGDILAPSQWELLRLKKNIQDLNKAIIKYELEIERMSHLNALTNVICSELVRYKTVVSETCKNGLLINAASPKSRISARMNFGREVQLEKLEWLLKGSTPQMEQRLANLENELHEAETAKQDANNNAEETKKKNGMLEHEVKEFVEHKHEFTQQKVQFEHKIAAFIEEKSQYEKQISDFTQQKVQFEHKLVALVEEKGQYEKQISELSQKLKKIKAQQPPIVSITVDNHTAPSNIPPAAPPPASSIINAAPPFSGIPPDAPPPASSINNAALSTGGIPPAAPPPGKIPDAAPPLDEIHDAASVPAAISAVSIPGTIPAAAHPLGNIPCASPPSTTSSSCAISGAVPPPPGTVTLIDLSVPASPQCNGSVPGSSPTPGMVPGAVPPPGAATSASVNGVCPPSGAILGGAPPLPGVNGVSHCAAPPPLMISKVILPTKPKISPSVPMKSLYWKRIIVSNREKKTVWTTLRNFELNIEEFENEFRQKVVKSKPIVLKSKSTKVIHEVLRVLDDKRSKAVAIFLRNLRYPVEKLRPVILGMNELTESQVDSLQSKLPSQEEIAEIESKNSDDAKWDRPEQFFIMLSNIPDLSVRLKVWSYELRLEESVDEVRKSFKLVISACQELINCKSLISILEIVLSCGNYMNGGTSKGQADGFDLEILRKLANTKGTTSTSNLLKFVAKIAFLKVPESTRLSHELRHVTRASSGLSIMELNSQLQKIKSGLGDIQNSYKDVENVGEDDHFQERASRIVSNALDHICSLELDQKECSSSFKSVVDFFGTSHNEKTSPDFLSLFADFVKDLSTSLPVQNVKKAASKFRRHKTGTKIAGGDNMAKVVTQIISGENKSGGFKLKPASLRKYPVQPLISAEMLRTTLRPVKK